MTLAAPFPYFGGKRRAAQLIWPRFGDPGGYVEPFAGSAAWDDYQEMLTNGIAKEVARVVLPLNVFTKWRLRINLRSALNFLSLRVRDDTSAYPSKPMLEIQEVALAMEKIIDAHCPVTMEAFRSNGRVAP